MRGWLSELRGTVLSESVQWSTCIIFTPLAATLRVTVASQDAKPGRSHDSVVIQGSVYAK